jgi:hypothetical protein
MKLGVMPSIVDTVVSVAIATRRCTGLRRCYGNFPAFKCERPVFGSDGQWLGWLGCFRLAWHFLHA